LLKNVLNKISLFCVQADIDAERLIRLGVPKDKIRVAGNMKFDTEDKAPPADKYRPLLELKPQEQLWVCGSTHPGEEEIILEAYAKLLAEFPRLKLLIAPRHPERASEISVMLSKLGFRAGFISKLPLQPCNCVARSVFILDLIGELVSFYNIADITFVGGSLVKKGGHNILEPAALSKPVITGPHMFNFRDIAGSFIENKACVVVDDAQGLYAAVKDLLGNPEEINRITQRAKEVILKNQGATRRNIEYITELSPVN
jgi:3-deoxy-D-manno-octulosonic-acid transferase